MNAHRTVWNEATATENRARLERIATAMLAARWANSDPQIDADASEAVRTALDLIRVIDETDCSQTI